MPRFALTITQTFARRTEPLDVAEAAALVAGGCGCGGSPTDESFAVDDPGAAPGAVTWSGVIGVEGELTGDGRLIEPNALRWENLPILLRHSPVDNGGHDGALAVGRILSISRGQGGMLNAKGDFFDSPEGSAAAKAVADGFNGVSMDLDDVDFEIRVAKEILDEEQQMLDDGPAGAAEDNPTDDQGRVTVIAMDSDDEVMVTTGARVRAATIVQIPAFATALISVDAAPADAPAAPTTAPVGDAVAAAGTVIPLRRRGGPAALVAGGYPARPPRAWFADPQLAEGSPLTITEDGRVYGHLALWGTCHTAYPGQCVSPPSSAAGYAYFRTGAVLTAEGDEVAVGHITMDTLHAGRDASPTSTLAHYEDTGRTVADVSVGEDSFGIWVAGGLRPGTTEAQVRALRASPLSGDWRRMGGNLELLAALAVNTPGFPIPRPQGLVASGVMTSLVASGMVPPRQVFAPGTPGALSNDDLRYLKRLAARERAASEVRRPALTARAEELAARVRLRRASDLARRVEVSSAK